MSSLTRTDPPALEQLSARTTLPVPSRIAVKAAWLYVLWSHRRKSRRDLNRLDDTQLCDIGLSRKDAHIESRKWFWRA